MRTLALVLSLTVLVSLVALGVLGLVTWGGGDDETTTSDAIPEIATADAGPPVERKSCGSYTRWTLVVEGDISCAEAHRVFRALVHQKLPRPWACTGPDRHTVCTKGAPSAHEVLITATL